MSRSRKTAAQLRHEALLLQKEAKLLFDSMAGMSGDAALDRVHQVQRRFDQARKLRKLAKERD